MKDRHLKVRKTHRDYFHKNMKYKGNPTTSLILLKGTWLEKAGFTIGKSISVRVTDECLVIEVKD